MHFASQSKAPFGQQLQKIHYCINLKWVRKYLCSPKKKLYVKSWIYSDNSIQRVNQICKFRVALQSNGFQILSMHLYFHELFIYSGMKNRRNVVKMQVPKNDNASLVSNDFITFCNELGSLEIMLQSKLI